MYVNWCLKIRRFGQTWSKSRHKLTSYERTHYTTHQPLRLDSIAEVLTKIWVWTWFRLGVHKRCRDILKNTLVQTIMFKLKLRFKLWFWKTVFKPKRWNSARKLHQQQNRSTIVSKRGRFWWRWRGRVGWPCDVTEQHRSSATGVWRL